VRQSWLCEAWDFRRSAPNGVLRGALEIDQDADAGAERSSERTAAAGDGYQRASAEGRHGDDGNEGDHSGAENDDRDVPCRVIAYLMGRIGRHHASIDLSAQRLNAGTPHQGEWCQLVVRRRA
jgi:hypothetical protein